MNVKEIRRRNMLNALEFILIHGDTTRKQLANGTHAELSTVTYVTQELSRLGLLIVKGKLKGTKISIGRPTESIGLDRSFGYVIGIKVGRESVNAILYDISLKPVGSIVDPIKKRNRNSKDILKKIKNVIDKFSSEYDDSKILGVGVAVSGIVNSHTGTLVASYVLNCFDLPIKKELKKYFPNRTIRVMNDVDALIVNEISKGEREDFLMITFGTGIGAGYFHNGKVYADNEGYNAFRIGHYIVNENGERCYCGQKGCLETYASEYVVYKEEYPNSQVKFKDFILNIERYLPGLKKIREKAKVEDGEIRKKYDPAFDILARAISNLIILLRPRKILLGGEGIVHPWMVERIEKFVDKKVSPMFSRETHFEKHIEEEDAWQRGIAFYVVKEIMAKIVRKAVKRSVS